MQLTDNADAISACPIDGHDSFNSELVFVVDVNTPGLIVPVVRSPPWSRGGVWRRFSLSSVLSFYFFRLPPSAWSYQTPANWLPRTLAISLPASSEGLWFAVTGVRQAAVRRPYRAESFKSIPYPATSSLWWI